MPSCIICGKEFFKRYGLQKTCSTICSKELHRRTHQKNLIERKIKFKNIVLNHYGSKCACCGESTPEFLTIDHINGEGNKHRKQEHCDDILEWLIRNNLPNGFQVLCMNCNFVKDIHKKQFCKVHHPELYEIHS